MYVTFLLMSALASWFLAFLLSTLFVCAKRSRLPLARTSGFINLRTKRLKLLNQSCDDPLHFNDVISNNLWYLVEHCVRQAWKLYVQHFSQ